MEKKFSLGSLLLSTKITAFLYITSLIIFLSMEIFVYSNAIQLADNQMTTEGYAYCNEGTGVARNACSYIKGVANYSIAESSIQNIFASSEEFKGNGIETSIIDYIRSMDYILNIIIYTPSGIPLKYMAIDGSTGPVFQGNRRFFKSFMQNDSDRSWEFIDERSTVLFVNDNSPKLSLWVKIYSAANSRVVGVLCISIDTRNLFTFDIPYPSSFSRNMFILDSQSGKVAANRTDYVITDETASTLFAKTNNNGSSGKFHMVTEEGNTIVIYERISDTPLYAFYYLSSDSLAVYAADIQNTIYISIAVYLLLIIPLITIVGRWLTKPLNKLRQSMDTFSEGDFDIRLSFNTDDEIGKLGRAFNNMVEKNKQLIDETYVAQIKAREAELLLQQAQIDPHFMYNLINSIQWSAMRRGADDIAETAHSLGQILRISLNRGKSMITVARECELARYYLELEKKRWKNRLGFSILCSDAANTVIIPKLIIQPLVENSVKHGMPAAGTMMISVVITCENDELIVDVKDDGKGIPPEILSRLPASYSSQSVHSNGFAVKNIYERLVLLYGDEFVFEITSGINEGTSVHIRIPARTDESGEGGNVSLDNR